MTTNTVEKASPPIESLLHSPVSIHDCFTLVDRIKFHAKSRADKTMATWLDRQGAVVDQMSFGQLHLRACALAARLDETCARINTRSQSDDGGRSPVSALIVCNPGFDFIVSLVACFYAGVAAVPAYPLRREEEYARFQAVLLDSGARRKASIRASATACELSRTRHAPNACRDETGSRIHCLDSVYIRFNRTTQGGDGDAR